MENPQAALSPTKRALLALKTLQARLDAVEQAQREPIAIIGMSCRLPGGVESPTAFWKLLQKQADAISEVPNDRWPIEKYYDAKPNVPGKMISRSGGFVPYLYDFDAAFFRISPREALTLDPQQRLALELGWEALEHAGIAPDSLAKEDRQSVGVFLGISSIDHWQQRLAQSPEEIDAYLATGNSHGVAAGRLSFLLGVNGPSLAVDTACSSSLVAAHLACQSLRQQECDLALVGGVNRILTPAASINFSKARMLSADGRCRTFDRAASGFGRAEGGGMVVLKRLSDAQAAGDRIHAVILGSATNHNGRTNGLTAPSKAAQVAVIQQALTASRLTAADVSYVETHGTGTALGDPIEVGALGQVFSNSERVAPIVLGALKTNIGHMEAAAGIAGLIKTALAIEHEQIPANLHLDCPNPLIEWDALPFCLPERSMSWPTTTDSRTAGVSAFGFNGTNAHLIVQSPPALPSGSQSPESQSHRSQSPESQSPRSQSSESQLLVSQSPRQSDRDCAQYTAYLLPLSARSPAALNQLIARYAQSLASHADIKLADVCFTASVGRSHFSCRIAIVSTSLSVLRQILIATLSGRPQRDCYYSNSYKSSSPVLSSSSDLPVVSPTAISLSTISLAATAKRYARGETIDWDALYQGQSYIRLALPTYPFQREYYGPDRDLEQGSERT
ncbi:MAG: beta-ketoacyl synthase N-terminal-like domain-containing protein [Cyanobacteria bacterium P01_D01_bin.1]